MTKGEYQLTVECDNLQCVGKGSPPSMVSAKNFSQARMKLIRAGWKIRKNKALCSLCVSAGLRMSSLIPRKPKNA